MYAIFLNTLYRVGFKKLAVHIADYWGNHTSSPLKNRDYAALELAMKQTVYPICPYCHWPVLSNRPHTLCEHELTHYWCDNCCEAFPINERAKHEDSCKDHEAEWEAFVPEEETRLADEARWLKEENAAMEAYFAEQEDERQREIAEAEEASWPEDDEPDFDEETGPALTVAAKKAIHWLAMSTLSADIRRRSCSFLPPTEGSRRSPTTRPIRSSTRPPGTTRTTRTSDRELGEVQSSPQFPSQTTMFGLGAVN
jgi:hypothetical protein